MRSRLKLVFTKLASLLWNLGRPSLYLLWILRERWPKRADWAWQMVHQPKWQKSTGLNLVLWPLSIVSLHFGVKYWGHGLALMLIQGCAVDAAMFPAFKERDTAVPASGGRAVLVSGFFFLFHKLLAVVLMMMCGWGTIETRLALGGVGVVENPVVFVIRKEWVFTNAGLRELFAAHHRKEMARAVAIGHWMRFKIGV